MRTDNVGNRPSRRFWPAVVAVAAWMLYLLVVASAAGTGSGSSGPFDFDLRRPDLAAHFEFYFVLTALLRWAVAGVGGSGRRAAVACTLVPLVIAVGYGGLMELVQLSVPGRAAAWDDFAANSLGALVATAVITTLLPIPRLLTRVR